MEFTDREYHTVILGALLDEIGKEVINAKSSTI